MDMDGGSQGTFYRPLTDEFCQGDIFGCFPLVRLRTLPDLLQKITIGPKTYALDVDRTFNPDTAEPKRRQRCCVATECDYTNAILLTHDCEIDKSLKVAADVTLAILRPFDATVNEESRARFRNGDKRSAFYLPAFDPLPECYVDFRRLVSALPDVFKSRPRIHRLSESARDAMMFHFFRFLTRRIVNSANTTTDPDPEG
jgi:hypothetical protein